MTDLPGALLLDLDDTILDSYSDPDEAWLQLCREFAGGLAGVTPEKMHAAVKSSRDWLWGDPERALEATSTCRSPVGTSCSGHSHACTSRTLRRRSEWPTATPPSERKR